MESTLKHTEGLLFSSWLEGLAAQYGDRPAVTCGQTVSFAQMDEYARRCAQRLVRAGVRKGDRVVLWAVNGIDWLVGFFGIELAGGVATLMNYGLDGKDVAHLAKMVGASWMLLGTNKVSAQDSRNAVQAALEGGIPRERILRTDELLTECMDPGVPIDGALLEKRAAAIRPKDTSIIIFTTGTTALPKAVQLSSRSMLSDVLCFAKLMEGCLGGTVCVALPLFHSYGLVMTLLYMHVGSHVHHLPLLKPDLVMDLMHRNGVRDISTVVAILGRMAQLPDFAGKLSGRLGTCILGGGFTTPAEMVRLESALGGADLLNGYGQTECSPVISCPVPSDPLERRAVSVGHPLPGMDVRIWREGDGFLPAGEIGEVVVKGPNTMNGYYGLPPEQQPFDADGWLHTGDLGLIAEDGLLQLRERLKDIIIRGGENISPMEIEQAILEEGCVREVKVLGAPHPIWGESVEACVVLSGNGPLDVDALRGALRKRLAAYKIPDHFFVYSAFPLTSNGKLDRRALKSDMLQRLCEVV